MHINQLLFTELLVFEMSHIMLPKSQLLCTAYIVLYKKLKVIACDRITPIEHDPSNKQTSKSCTVITAVVKNAPP